MLYGKSITEVCTGTSVKRQSTEVRARSVVLRSRAVGPIPYPIRVQDDILILHIRNKKE